MKTNIGGTMKDRLKRAIEKIIGSSERVNEIETKLKNLGDYDETLHKQHGDFFRIHARRMDSIERKLKILAFAMVVLLGLTIYLLLSR